MHRITTDYLEDKNHLFSSCDMASSNPNPATKPSEKRSLIWTHFRESAENKASCDLCGMKVPTAGNTTNMTKVYDYRLLLL